MTLPPGGTFSSLISGVPVKSSFQVKWTAINPKNSKPKTVASDKFKPVATFTQSGTGVPITINSTSPTINNVKSLFNGKHIAVHFVIDETQTTLTVLP